MKASWKIIFMGFFLLLTVQNVAVSKEQKMDDIISELELSQREYTEKMLPLDSGWLKDANTLVVKVNVYLPEKIMKKGGLSKEIIVSRIESGLQDVGIKVVHIVDTTPYPYPVFFNLDLTGTDNFGVCSWKTRLSLVDLGMSLRTKAVAPVTFFDLDFLGFSSTKEISADINRSLSQTLANFKTLYRAANPHT